MSFDTYTSDMEDNNVPPSLVDETSIRIHLPMASSSDDRSSPIKAPSLSSQSEIYISSDKDEGHSEREESTQNEDNDNTTQDEENDCQDEYFEQIRKLHKVAVERQELTKPDEEDPEYGDEYFIPIKRIRKEQAKREDKNYANNDEEGMGSRPDEYFRSIKRIQTKRVDKANAKNDEEDMGSRPDQEFFRPIKRIQTKREDKNNAKNNEEDMSSRPDEEYFRPIKKLRMVEARQEMVPSPPKPLTSFFIKDILNHKPALPRRHSMTSEPIIVRPWDLGVQSRQRPRSADDETRSEKSESESSSSPEVMAMNASPLDALFEMTSKAFEGLDAEEKSSGKRIFLFIHV